MSIRTGGKTSVEVTEKHFFYEVVIAHIRDAEVYVDGKLVREPNEITQRRVVPYWGRIIVAILFVGFMIFLCTMTIGFQSPFAT